MHFNLTRRGIKEKEDGEWGRGEAIILGRQLFEIFPSKGGLFEGRLLFEELRYLYPSRMPS